MQLDLFRDQEFQALNKNVTEYKDSSDRVRRGIFGRLDAHKKEMEAKMREQREEIEDIKILLQNLGLRERVG